VAPRVLRFGWPPAPEYAEHPVYSYRMWAAVEFTDCKGVKLRPGEAHPRGSLEGEIQTYALGARRASVISVRLDVRGPDLAVLYGPRLAGIGPDVIRVLGFERSGQAWVRQEWICFLKARPRDVPGEPTRDRRP
jgi:hypothetical protein